MIFGIGTDLCDIARIQRALDRFGERFAGKILVAAELERFRQHHSPAAFLAKRFAAKEAFSKAIGTGIQIPISWHDIWVESEASGKPLLCFSGRLRAVLHRQGIASVHVSLTDEKGLACAFVILEG
jgi:holo-[acyl-carrier protein] synthase